MAAPEDVVRSPVQRPQLRGADASQATAPATAVAVALHSLGGESPVPTERDRRKERERTELVQMILESIANVPVAVARIHTNEKLRAALREEMGHESALLDQFFDNSSAHSTADRNGNGNFESKRDEETAYSERSSRSSSRSDDRLSVENLVRWNEENEQRQGRYELLDGVHTKEMGRPQQKVIPAYVNATSGNGRNGALRSISSQSNSSSSSSVFDAAYEQDLADAVNQLVMSDQTLSSMDKGAIVAAIPIRRNSVRSNEVNRMSSTSPQSSVCLGASPSNISQDGEPVSALWPRQPNQFVFTQEEEGTVRGEDEVYSEIISSMCEDESLRDDDGEEEEEDDDDDEEDFGEAEKVFQMDEDDTPLSNSSETNYRRNDTFSSNGQPAEFRDSLDEEVDVEGDSADDADDQEDDYDDLGQDREYDTFQLRIVREKNRTGFEPHQDWKPRTGSLIGGRYKVRSQC